MSDKKQDWAEMGIECVEFDDQENQVASTIIPLGHFLHEGPATKEEQQMTSQLVAYNYR